MQSHVELCLLLTSLFFVMFSGDLNCEEKIIKWHNDSLQYS